MPKQSRRYSPEGATISRHNPSEERHQKDMNGRSSSSSSSKGGRQAAAILTSTNVPGPSAAISPSLDLKVIDDAFGKTSDLYTDVLQVPTDATQEEIQLAYFDRRSELFTLLAKIDSKPQSESMVAQRYRAERKMDSVVLAVRILGDPALRASYDTHIRPIRVPPSSKGKAQQQQSQQVKQTATRAVSTPERTSSRRPAVSTGQQQPSVVTPTGMMTMKSKEMEQTTIELQPRFSVAASASSSPSPFNRKTSRNAGGSKALERTAKKKRQESSGSDVGGGGNGSWFPFSSSAFNSNIKSYSAPEPIDKVEAGVADSKKSAAAAAAATAPAVAVTSARTNSNTRPSASWSTAAAAARTKLFKSKSGQITSLDTFESETSGVESATAESRHEDETQTQAETVETLSTFDNYDGADDVDTVMLFKGKKNSGGDGFFSCITASRTLKSISDEISGACEDTLVSVDQVFNAFTLTDKDIKAVTKKIEKAKRQLDS